MIKSALFIGIQRHIETHLEFHPGFNAIIGDTASGKSALWRGINWPRTNRPLGPDHLMNFDMNHMQVEINFDDIGTVKRYRNRSGSKNYYQLNDEEPFTGFGHNPPEPIVKAMNIGDINIQHQKDQFFLLNDSAPEVSRYLNKIANLEVIDRALSNAKKEADSNAAAQRKFEAETEALETELKEFAYLTDMEADLEDLEGFQTQANSVGYRANTLKASITKWQALNAEIKELEPYLDAETELENIRKQYEQYLGIKKKREELQALINNYNELKAIQDSVIDFQAAEADLTELKKQLNELNDLQYDINDLEGLISSHSVLNKNLTTMLGEIEDKENQLKSKSKGLCTILEAGKCPLI